MKLIAYFIVTLIIGTAGGIIAKKLKVPAGGIVGAMLAVALFNVLTGNAVYVHARYIQKGHYQRTAV